MNLYLLHSIVLLRSHDHLVARVAGKLKGLFLLFAGHMIPSSVEVLKEISDSELGSHDLTV